VIIQVYETHSLIEPFKLSVIKRGSLPTVKNLKAPKTTTTGDMELSDSDDLEMEMEAVGTKRKSTTPAEDPSKRVKRD